MHVPQAVRSLWIGYEHTGKSRSGGDARPIASPMRRACTRPQAATAARRWSPAARGARLQPSCSCAPRGRARRALCGPWASGQIPCSGPPGGSVWALAELDPGPPMGAGGSGPPGSMQEPHHRAVACGDASGRAEIARTVKAVQMTIQRNRPVTGTMSLRYVT